MKLNVLFLILVVTACVGAIAVTTEHADASITIAPLGDSITRGGGGPDSAYPSYRYYLWNTLRNAGYSVDFVGSKTEPDYTDFAFDQDNDGYSGFTTGRLATEMDRILASYTPAIVLLDIGTNDVLQQTPMSERMANLGRIVASLRQKNPNVRILIAQISPTADAYRNTHSGLDEYNGQIVAYARGATTPASPIVVVDMNTGWSPAQLTQADGIHPTTAGEKELARRWADALIGTGMLNPTGPVRTPTPSPSPTTAAPPSPVPTTVVPATTAAPTTVVTATPAGSASPAPGAAAPRSIAGKRYAVGNPGSYIGGTFGAGGTGSGSRSGATVTTGTRLRPGSRAAGVTPPSGKFVRWYPATRWATGLR